jgi:nitrogen-specific signal transduction histidine kinase/CheY-like chemotaxis protein
MSAVDTTHESDATPSVEESLRERPGSAAHRARHPEARSDAGRAWRGPRASGARCTLVRVWEHDLATGRSNWVDDLFGEVDVPADERVYDAFLKRHVHPEDLPAVLRGFEVAVRERRPFEARYRMTDATGRWRAMLDRARIVRASDGTARKLVGTCRDVSGLSAPEPFPLPTLRESLDGLEEACQQGRLVHRDGLPLYASRRLVELLGYADVEDFLALARVNELLAPEQWDGAPGTGALPLQRFPEAQRCELRARRKDGSRVQLDAILVPAHWEGMTVAQLTVIESTAHSDGEPKPAGAHLRPVGGWLPGGMAHELNNLLQIVAGNAGMLLAGPGLAPATAEGLRRIEGAAVRGSALVRRLLAGEREVPLAPKPLGVQPVIEHVVELMRPATQERCTILVEPAQALPPAQADREALEHVLMNLLANACDAMPAGGAVRIGTGVVHVERAQAAAHPGVAPGAFVRITVRDDGVGMSEEVLARLFDPHFTTKPAQAGSGLGMTMVRWLVQQQHGFVRVESRRGKGTAVHVHLPATDDTSAAAAAALPARNALLVQADPLVGGALRRLLETMQMGVLRAGEAAAALPLLEDPAAAVALVVLNLPLAGDCQGRATCEQLRQRAPGVPVLFVTDPEPQADAVAFMLEHGGHYLSRPFRLDELQASVRQALGVALAV